MSYKPFTLKAALELASPPTWAASIGPVLVAGAAAFTYNDLVPFNLDLRALVAWVLMLLIAVLMQSAVNSLNDYHDFCAGTDTAETILDETDASIVYNSIDPKAALRFGLALLAVAAVCGVVVMLISRWYLLPIGVLGALVVVLYSFGPKPISYLPLGEAVSGLVMGGMITAATYIALTLSFTPLMLVVAVPPFLTIAQIMLTNNTCDIDRDIIAGRQTLAIALGARRARLFAGGLAVFTLLWMGVISFLFWIIALITTAITAILGHGLIRRLAAGPYNTVNRGRMMKTATSWCWLVNVCWAFGLFAAGLIKMVGFA